MSLVVLGTWNLFSPVINEDVELLSPFTKKQFDTPGTKATLGLPLYAKGTLQMITLNALTNSLLKFALSSLCLNSTNAWLFNLVNMYG